MNYQGDFLEDATVYIPFNTFDSNDPSASVTITNLVAGDVEIWKDGVIQTTPGAGVTLTLNIGTGNGSHLIAVDTSNTTDASFYVTGADYLARINGTTVDSATVNAWVGGWSTENRFTEVNVTAMTAGVIANATFNADVGSTAHGTNIIALAVRKILEELNIDHLAKVDTTVAAAGDLTAYVVNGSILSHIISNSNTVDYKSSEDSLNKIRDDRTLAAADYVVVGDTIAGVTNVGTVTGNVNGSVGSVTGAVGSVTGSVGSVSGHTNQTGDSFAIVNGASGLVAVKAETATIVTDTNAIQGKLPTNKFMGSSDGADDNGTLDTINTNAARLTAVRAAILTDWIDGGRLDVLLDAVKAVTDNMSAAATTMITGTVSWDNTNATTTIIYSDDITEATADHYNGRLFVPTSGALVGQYTDITDYALDTGEGKFTVTAMTEPPADNTTFVIL